MERRVNKLLPLAINIPFNDLAFTIFSMSAVSAGGLKSPQRYFTDRETIRDFCGIQQEQLMICNVLLPVVVKKTYHSYLQLKHCIV